MGESLLERLSGGAPLVADGATGTMLMAAGLPAGTLALTADDLAEIAAAVERTGAGSGPATPAAR